MKFSVLGSSTLAHVTQGKFYQTELSAQTSWDWWAPMLRNEHWFSPGMETVVKIDRAILFRWYVFFFSRCLYTHVHNTTHTYKLKASFSGFSLFGAERQECLQNLYECKMYSVWKHIKYKWRKKSLNKNFLEGLKW